MVFFETSAKTAEHVGECFTTITSNIVKDLDKNMPKKKSDAPQNNIDLGSKSVGQGNRGKGYCCWSNSVLCIAKYSILGIDKQCIYTTIETGKKFPKFTKNFIYKEGVQ